MWPRREQADSPVNAGEECGQQQCFELGACSPVKRRGRGGAWLRGISMKRSVALAGSPRIHCSSLLRHVSFSQSQAVWEVL